MEVNEVSLAMRDSSFCW